MAVNTERKKGNEKALRKVQTLHAGCSKAKPKKFCHPADGILGFIVPLDRV